MLFVRLALTALAFGASVFGLFRLPFEWFTPRLAVGLGVSLGVLAVASPPSHRSEILSRLLAIAGIFGSLFVVMDMLKSLAGERPAFASPMTRAAAAATYLAFLAVGVSWLRRVRRHK